MSTNTPRHSRTPQRSSHRPRQAAGQSAGSGTRFRGAQRTGAHRRPPAAPSSRPVQPAGARMRTQSAQRRRADRRRGMTGCVAALAVVVLLALVGWFVVWPVVGDRLGLIDNVADGQAVELTIPEGASGDDIAQLLSENHVVDNPRDYYAAVEQLDAASQIKPGDYALTTHMGAEDVVRQLVEGPNVEGLRLTVAEGLTVSQTAAAVEEALGISADDFTAQAKASNYASDYACLADAANDSLEGFLTPKTYTFGRDAQLTADDVIRTMLDQYEVEVAQFDFASAEAAIQSRYGVTMSDYDIITMASIIEREAITSEQRPKVSSTFYNRLAQGMALQSDATMMYVTGGEVTAADLETESPYNTYLNQGLTPTPICTPSAASIEAALNPAETDYLYFFITQDNEYFSATYDEHLQAIEENR